MRAFFTLLYLLKIAYCSCNPLIELTKLLPELFCEVHSLRMPRQPLPVIAYSDKGLSIQLHNGENFCPTNIRDFPVNLINGDIKFSKDPKTILAIKDYINACYQWSFPKEREASKTEYYQLIAKLRDSLRQHAKPYAERTVSIDDIIFDDFEKIHALNFSFLENETLKGTISFADDAIKWQENTNFDESKFHPPLQINSCSYKGTQIPYLYIPAKGDSNGKTLIIIHGGPDTQYEGNYSQHIKTFTDSGWGVIIPQENLRTGYGWEHYKNGFGKIGAENLYQILYTLQDANKKGLIPDMQQMTLYGCSYGGVASNLFALRWQELHAEAELPITFSFQAIIAEASMVDCGEEPCFWAPQELRFKRQLPLHAIGKTLSAPLTLIHGLDDETCPTALIKEFSTKLTEHGHKHNVFWHNEPHTIYHPLFPRFLLAIAENQPIDPLLSSVGFTKG